MFLLSRNLNLSFCSILGLKEVQELSFVVFEFYDSYPGDQIAKDFTVEVRSDPQRLPFLIVVVCQLSIKKWVVYIQEY